MTKPAPISKSMGLSNVSAHIHGGLALLGVSMALIGVADTIPVAVVGMFLVGFMVTMVVAARQSIIQKAVPPAL